MLDNNYNKNKDSIMKSLNADKNVKITSSKKKTIIFSIIKWLKGMF